MFHKFQSILSNEKKIAALSIKLIGHRVTMMREGRRAEPDVKKPNYTVVHFIRTHFKIEQNNNELLLVFLQFVYESYIKCTSR